MEIVDPKAESLRNTHHSLWYRRVHLSLLSAVGSRRVRKFISHLGGAERESFLFLLLSL